MLRTRLSMEQAFARGVKYGQWLEKRDEAKRKAKYEGKDDNPAARKRKKEDKSTEHKVGDDVDEEYEQHLVNQNTMLWGKYSLVFSCL